MGILCWLRRHVREIWPPSRRKGRSSFLCEPGSICGQRNRLQLFKLDSQGGFTEKPNTGGTDKDSKQKPAKTSLENSTTFRYRCVCLNARSIVNNIN